MKILQIHHYSFSGSHSKSAEKAKALTRFFLPSIFIIILLLKTTNALAAKVAVRAADIYSGETSSYPMYLTVYNDKLYFQADGNDGAGKEMWSYDGSTASRVTDISSGSESSNPSYLAVYNGKLYFGAYQPATGLELWSYDGTTASLVADIRSGAAGSIPSYLAVYDGKLYFAADSGDGAGRELWCYDETTDTASRVEDIFSGSTGSNPTYLTVYDGMLYFAAINTVANGRELWVYDGSATGMAANIEVKGDSYPAHLAAFDGKLYFQAYTKGSPGTELWSYDSSIGFASLEKDIRSGNFSSDPTYMMVYDGKLYFAADGGDGAGKEIWSYDGANASLVMDVRSGVSASNPTYLVAYDDELYFSADGGDGAGTELWHLYEDAAPGVETTSPANGVTISPTFTLQVGFSEDVLHNGSADAADYTDNYVLVEALGDDFQTTACNATDFTSDTRISVNSAAYSNNAGAGPYRTTLTVNGGTALPQGSYRLLVCGTTSIEDLVGNELNDGADQVIDFTVRNGASPAASLDATAAALPETGFKPGVETYLPFQSSARAYNDLGTLRLEIPALGVDAPILGVPISNGKWDVSWLGDRVGWLQGTSFPMQAGNSALSGHVYDANGRPGIFKELASLKWGDAVIVHGYGQAYVYEVRTVDEYVDPEDTDLALQHENYPWLTLITCEGYDEQHDRYDWRVVVRAVQVKID